MIKLENHRLQLLMNEGVQAGPVKEGGIKSKRQAQHSDTDVEYFHHCNLDTLQGGRGKKKTKTSSLRKALEQQLSTCGSHPFGSQATLSQSLPKTIRKYSSIYNSSKLQLQSNNEILRLGVIIPKGTVLRGHSIRRVENHGSRHTYLDRKSRGKGYTSNVILRNKEDPRTQAIQDDTGHGIQVLFLIMKQQGMDAGLTDISVMAYGPVQNLQTTEFTHTSP